jgi:hypothetical protein
MDARVKRFRAEALQQGFGGVGSRYPLELRRLAVSVVRERRSEPLSRVATELGVSVVSLQRWLEQAEPAQFRPVTLQAEPVEGGKTPAGPVLITPRGYRVEGLGVESLAALLRALG